MESRDPADRHVQYQGAARIMNSTWLRVGICVLSAALVGGQILASDDDPPQAKKPEDPFAAPRMRMVERHLVERGIKDPRVLDAFRTVPRHKFLPPDTQRLAYEDESIPIGEGQTITPPYDVAFMTEALHPKPTDKVYEVGTGSGYQASILSRLVKEVYSVEIKRPLGERAAKVIKELGYDNIHTRIGDGYAGWPDAAPFDAVIVTCAPQAIPPPLVEQLKEGGRMVIPLGDRYLQKVHIYEKKEGKLVGRAVGGTLFVPMTGRAQEESAKKAKEKAKP
jgi:protein-L-isoaspartate(D-aspartate) O-methyltransferase